MYRIEKKIYDKLGLVKKHIKGEKEFYEKGEAYQYLLSAFKPPLEQALEGYYELQDGENTIIYRVEKC